MESAAQNTEHSKTAKNAKKLSVFGENDSRRLKSNSNSYRDVTSAFFDIFVEKDFCAFVN